MADTGASRVRLEESAPLVHALVSRAASDIGLRVLAIKGPALALQGLRADRPSADVDVLVHPDELDQFIQHMVGMGWFKGLVASAPVVRPSHSVDLLSEFWPTGIDVHHYFPGFMADAGDVFDLLWARRCKVDLAGVAVPACDRVAHTALAALHYLRDPQSPMYGTRLSDLTKRAQHTLTQRDMLDLIALAEETGAVGPLRPFLSALVIPGSQIPAPSDAHQAEWEFWVNAPESTQWLLLLKQTPLRDWPRTIWYALMLTDVEVRVLLGSRDEAATITQLRLRRLRRGARTMPKALLTLARRRWKSSA